MLHYGTPHPMHTAAVTSPKRVSLAGSQTDRQTPWPVTSGEFCTSAAAGLPAVNGTDVATTVAPQRCRQSSPKHELRGRQVCGGPDSWLAGEDKQQPTTTKFARGH